MADRVVILGGGLAGLSAGFFLLESRKEAVILEREHVPGGLARTIPLQEARFDLGGHRFLTEDPVILGMVQTLMGDELIVVSRRSKILKDRRYFEYPLRPLEAIAAVGLATSLKIVASYGMARLRKNTAAPKDGSLEDWLVGRFGRTLFQLFFRDYSEKVWGTSCSEIDADLAAKRIGGLSLMEALRRSLPRRFGAAGEMRTSKRTFLYPSLGIGRISERLVEEIELRGGTFLPRTEVVEVHHNGGRITGVSIAEAGGSEENSRRKVEGSHFISSIPITSLLSRMNPPPPRKIFAAAQSLRYRDLVVVALLVHRPRITEETWIYVPDREIPFGRIHEPVNWSPGMAPEGETVLVAEYFCSEGDGVWHEADGSLADRTIRHLEAMRLIRREDVLGFKVVRAPKAYPVPHVGYEAPYTILKDYLSHLENLQVIGRTGRFRYFNMDEAMKDGLQAARTILSGKGRVEAL